MPSSRVAFVVPLVTLPAAAFAQAPSEPDDAPLDVGAYVDVFYGFNPAFPGDRVNFPAGFGATAKRANEFGLNLAAIELAVAPDPVGVRLVLGAGSFADVTHAAELGGAAAGPDVFRFVQIAAASWRPTGPLLLEAGIMPSHIGFESVFTRDNFNYTHAWVSELTPYYQTGVRAQYTFSDEWSAQLLFVNGWQVIADTNDAKSFGAQLAWTAGPATILLNGWAGPELAGDDDQWRYLAEFVARLEASSWLRVATQADFGWQQRPGEEEAAIWQNAALWTRFGSDVLWLALRGEYIRDVEGGITGTRQNLREATATIAYRAAEPLLLKLEARHDRSSEAVFPGSEDLRKDQTLATFGAVASY